jgi:S-adenosylmethionine hydrolase
MEIPPPNGLITLTTDFGLSDPYVGIMKGVIKKLHARAEVVDYCHGVPAQDVAIGAMYLHAAVGRFPVGTVHVAVVDPGVGTERRALCVCAAGCYWLAPDNGLLSAVLAASGESEARHADLEKLRLRPQSHTFHGRDVFAPLGAMLASGRWGYRALGPIAAQPVRMDELGGERVVAVDHFGNLITGVSAEEVAARRTKAVRIRDRVVPLRSTYQDVEPGIPLALINSYDRLEIAVCRGSAAASLRAGPGDPVVLLEDVL